MGSFYRGDKLVESSMGKANVLRVASLSFPRKASYRKADDSFLHALLRSLFAPICNNLYSSIHTHNIRGAESN